MAWDISNIIINLERRIKKLEGSSASIATTSKAGIVKPDGTTITVTSDGTITGAATGHTYSTSEQEIGTWIDGKTLYERTITYTLTGEEEENFIASDISTWGVDTLIFNDGYAWLVTGGILPLMYISNVGNIFSMYFDRANKAIKCVLSDNYRHANVVVCGVIRYTKEED